MAQKTPTLDWLSIREAAKYLGVSKDTLRRWEKRGKIKSYRTPGGRRRYTMYDLELAMKAPKTPSLITLKVPKRPEPKPRSIMEIEKPTPQPKVEQQTSQPAEPVRYLGTDRTFLKKLNLPLVFALIFILIIVLLAFFNIRSYLLSSGEILNPVPGVFQGF